MGDKHIKKTLEERRQIAKNFSDPYVKNAIEMGMIDIKDGSVILNEDIPCDYEDLKEFEKKLFSGEIIIR